MASLKSNAIANYLSQVWETAIGVVLIPIYIKLLGIESYGLIAFMSLLDVLAGVANFGLTSTLTQYVARASTGRDRQCDTRDIVRTLETVVICLAGLCGCLIVGAAGLTADHWLDSRSIDRTTVIMALRLMGGILCFRVTSAFYEGGIRGTQKHVVLGILRVSVSFGMRVGGVAFLYCVSRTIQGLFLWQLLWGILGTIALRTTLYRLLAGTGERPQFRWSILRLTKGFTIGMFVFTLSAILVAQVDRFVLSGMADLAVFAHYSLASTLASGLLPLAYPLVTTIQPRLVQLLSMNDMCTTVALYHVSNQFLVILILPIAVLLVVFPREVLSIWVRDSQVVEATAKLLVPLAIGGCVSSLYHAAHAAQIASEKPQVGIILNVTIGLGSSLLSIWSMRVLGVWWLATMKCVAIGLYVSIGTALTHYLVLKRAVVKSVIGDIVLPSLGVAIVAVVARIAMTSSNRIWAMALKLAVVWMVATLVALLLAGEVRYRLRIHVMKGLAYVTSRYWERQSGYRRNV